MVSVLAHSIAGTITNSMKFVGNQPTARGAWHFDPSGLEIGDNCKVNFGAYSGNYNLIVNKKKFFVQSLWLPGRGCSMNWTEFCILVNISWWCTGVNNVEAEREWKDEYALHRRRRIKLLHDIYYFPLSCWKRWWGFYMILFIFSSRIIYFSLWFCRSFNWI